MESIISIERPRVPYIDNFSLVHEGTVWGETEEPEITTTPAELAASNINENKPFDPQSHLDTLTKEVLTRLTDLHANDNDIELIKNTTLTTLQNDSLYSEWKVNSERDIKNKKHASNQMISICKEICIFCSQSGDPQKQIIDYRNLYNCNKFYKLFRTRSFSLLK